MHIDRRLNGNTSFAIPSLLHDPLQDMRLRRSLSALLACVIMKCCALFNATLRRAFFNSWASCKRVARGSGEGGTATVRHGCRCRSHVGGRRR